MAKKISKSDISEEDVFGAIRKSAEETISIIDKLSSALEETANTVKKSIGGAKFDSTKAIDNFVKASQQANKLTNESIKLEQQRAKAVQERNKAIQAQQKSMQEVNKTEQTKKKVAQESLKIEQEKEKLAQQRIRTESSASKEAERLAKIEQRKAKAMADEASAYKRLEKSVREQKNKSKELASTMLELERAGKKNSKEWRELAKQYRETTASAQQGDKTLKQIDQTVGDNFRNVGNYKDALSGLGKSFLALAGGMSVMSGIKGAFDIIRDFDQAQGDLQAISGKSREELAQLTEEAKQLGATTQFSATQITEMQIELAKLGFTSEQISASTGAVANFAAATGADIPRASALAGSALRAFGLEANEMERVVSTMGVATTKTALDFSALETGLSTVAPVAKAFGFSVEDTTALLGQLANSGFDASSSATATRNILLNLADANGDLAKELGRPIRSADDLAEGLKELQEKGIDLAHALELTDKRSVSAFQTFIDGSDSLVGLRDSITDVNDELEAMAQKRLDTISGQFTLLESAWEGFILSVNEGTGVGETVKNVIAFIAQNLNSLMSALGRVIMAWGTYKASLLAVKAVQWVMTGGLKAMTKNITGMVSGLKSMVTGTKNASTAVTGLGKAMNAVPFLAIIGMVVQLAQAFYEVANSARLARLQQELLERAEARAEETSSKILDKEKARFDEKMRQLDLEMRKRISNGENEKKINEERAKREKEIATESLNNIRVQSDSAKAQMSNLLVLTEMYQDYVDKLKSGSVAHSEVVKDASGLTTMTVAELNKEMGALIKQWNKGLQPTDEGFMQLGESSENLLRLKEEATASIQVVTNLSQAMTEYQNILEERLVMEEEVRAKYSAQIPAGKKVTKELKEHNSEFRKTIDLNERILDLLEDRKEIEQEINQIRRQREIRGLDDQIQREFEAQKASVQNTGEMDVEALDDLIMVKAEMRREAREAEAQFEIQQLNDKYNREMASIKKGVEDERKERLKEAEKTFNENLKIAGDNADKKAVAEARYNEALAHIELQYQEEIAKYKQIELQEATNVNAEIVALKETLVNDLAEIERDAGDEINTRNDELINMQKSYYDAQYQLALNNAENLRDLENKMWQDRMDMAQLATDFLIMLSDRRIAKYDEEIANAQKQADFLRELAINGNIDAKDSLAEQERIIAEANRKKILEERRKQKIEFANTVFQTYGSKVQSGSKTPFQDTIRDVSLLQQFISAFTPTYLEGTEDTGSNGRGIDGKGGFHAILHPNERVLTKQQNAMVGDLSNEQLAKVAQSYQNGTLISGSGAVQLGGGWDSHLVVEQLKSLEKTIKEKPEHVLGIENVVQGAMDIVRKTKSGRETIYNRYRVRK